MSKTRSELSTTRLSGQVARYHTWPTITQQSVGEHTWQLVRIYIEIWGPPEPEVCNYMIYHDSPEIITGDPPFPVKLDNPELRAIYDDMDERAMIRLTGGPMPIITTMQRTRVKICDLLEMWEFGKHEMMLGNQYAAPIVEDTIRTVVRMIEDAGCPPIGHHSVYEYITRSDR